MPLFLLCRNLIIHFSYCPVVPSVLDITVITPYDTQVILKVLNFFLFFIFNFFNLANHQKSFEGYLHWQDTWCKEAIGCECRNMPPYKLFSISWGQFFFLSFFGTYCFKFIAFSFWSRQALYLTFIRIKILWMLN